ncbi:MAG: hypothetical protein ACW976_00365 [Candidatus Ranarchaeia archaeon]
MSYVLACVTLFNTDPPEITIKARGRAISRLFRMPESIKSVLVLKL